MRTKRRIFNLSLRLTFKYRDGWACEDSWKNLGMYSLLKTRDYLLHDDGGMRHVWTVRVDHTHASIKSISKALLNTFTWGCQCEHDCCGHSQGYATEAVYKGGKEFVVIGYSYRNL